MTRVHRVVFAALCSSLVCSAPALSQSAPPPEVLAYADVVLHGGKVLTADDAFTVAQAVAIRDGRVLAVGDNARIRRMAGPRTQVIDLQGQTVTPGFIDTHFHLHNYCFNPMVNGGTDLFPSIKRQELEHVETKAQLLNVLRKRGQTDKRVDGWLVFSDSRGEDHSLLENTLFPQLTQKDLDEVLPDGPAAVGASHGNNYTYYILNSAGTEIAMKRLPAGTRGIILDRQTGKPTGQLTGEAASLFGRGVLPWPDVPLAIRLLSENIPKYTAQGITTIQTKTPGYVMAALRELWRRGQMPIRWRASLEVGPDLEVAFKYLGNLTDLGDPWLRIASGGGEVPAGFFDATYDKPKALPGESNRLGRRPDELKALREQLKDRPSDAYFAAKYGWSTGNVHNNGDLSTDVYLSELERGMRDRVVEAADQRFATDHGLMLTRETAEGKQFERMKKLGIVPSLNAGYLLEPRPVGTDNTLADVPSQVEQLAAQWGRERVGMMLPAKSLIKAGLKPTSESDRWYFPASYPLWLLEKLVTRKDDKFGIIWGGSERVTREEALWMKTNWAARYTAEDTDVGTIEPGKLADLVVLDKDYLTVPEDDISKIQVVMTIIGGRTIYDRARDGQPHRPGEELPSVSAAKEK